MLEEITQAADERSWSHAGMLLERMTSALDKEGHASDEATELYDFVVDQWKVLEINAKRPASIDDDRRAAKLSLRPKACLALAIEETLDALVKRTAPWNAFAAGFD